MSGPYFPPFEAWLAEAKFKPMPEGLHPMFCIAWDLALDAAIAQVPGGDICRPAEVADALRALKSKGLP